MFQIAAVDELTAKKRSELTRTISSLGNSNSDVEKHVEDLKSLKTLKTDIAGFKPKSIVKDFNKLLSTLRKLYENVFYIKNFVIEKLF